MLMAVNSLSAENESDPDVLEKARKYYPIRWTKEQLQTLVQMQKLTAVVSGYDRGDVYGIKGFQIRLCFWSKS